MNKKTCIVANVLLVIWFFLDMVGFRIGNFILTEMAWKDDGIFFVTYIVTFLLFLTKDKYGKYSLTIWLSLWFITQFFSHWYYTIFGVTDKKLTTYNRVYANTYHIFPASETILVPDLYHILLHGFILVALVCTISFCIKSRWKKDEIGC